MEERFKSILPFPPNADHSGKRGYAVIIVAGLAVIAGATDLPVGVILDGTDTSDSDSIAMCGGNCGTVPVMLNATPGTVVAGTYLQVCSDGSGKADTGSGARVIYARAMEGGTAGEIIEAILIDPKAIPAAAYELPVAAAGTLGGIKVGAGLAITDGVLSVAAATANTIGGIKVGDRLTITDGVLDADVQA